MCRRVLAHLFAGNEEILESHQGLDLGARELAVALADILKAPLHLAPVSRLVVDCNRSLGHRRLFSPFTGSCRPSSGKRFLPIIIILTGRRSCNRSGSVHEEEAASISASTVSRQLLHGKERTAEIGLLYDPSRLPEKEFCRSLGQAIKEQFPEFRIRYNYPYRGVSDGLIPALRRSFAPNQYIGLELEINSGIARSEE